MCFGPSTLGAGAKNTSRIQNKEVYATLRLQVLPLCNISGDLTKLEMLDLGVMPSPTCATASRYVQQQCRCKKGWGGANCTQCIASEHSCQNDAVCESVGTSSTNVTCSCPNGYTGDGYKSCRPICHGCQRGSCVAPDVCKCAEGFEGTNCDRCVAGRHQCSRFAMCGTNTSTVLAQLGDGHSFDALIQWIVSRNTTQSTSSDLVAGKDYSVVTVTSGRSATNAALFEPTRLSTEFNPMAGAYACTCLPGYNGDGVHCAPQCPTGCGQGTCAVRYTPTSIGVTRLNTSNTSGTFAVDGGEYFTLKQECSCKQGWVTANCSKCNASATNGLNASQGAAICAQNATCIAEEAGSAVGACRCNAGYAGDGANKCQPQCPLGCGHGVCVLPGVCSCTAGWGGANCSTCSVDNVCALNATCVVVTNTSLVLDEDGTSSQIVVFDHHNCTCDAGYKGNGRQCAAVCLAGCAYGSCVSPDKCTCRRGWGGEACNQCTSNPVYSPCVANSRCNSTDSCECNFGYSGDGAVECRPVCQQGCTNGKCAAPDACQCNTNGKNATLWTGASCNFCTSNSSCHANATCIAGANDMYGLPQATCMCNPGFGGDGVSSCSPQCRHGCAKGTCSGPDQCDCAVGWQNEVHDNCTECVPAALALQGDPDTLDSCNKNGVCMAKYQQSPTPSNASVAAQCWCKEPSYSIGNTSECDLIDGSCCQPVCAAPCIHGTCVAPDTCKCDSGWGGPQCSACPDDLCSSHAICIKSNSPKQFHEQLALGGYQGGAANSTYNLQEQHGCFCPANHTGNGTVCEPICSQGCLQGTCVAPDVCKCLNSSFTAGVQAWSGNDCSQCVQGAHGCHPNATCFTLTPGSARCVCNSGYNGIGGVECAPVCQRDCVHGKCTAPDTCTCDKSRNKGFGAAWTGDLCTDCVQGAHACHQNATCSSVSGALRCTCHDGWTGDGRQCFPTCSMDCGSNGKCIAPELCECKTGWTGTNCTLDCGCNFHSTCNAGVGKCDKCLGYTGGPNCSTCAPDAWGTETDRKDSFRPPYQSACRPCNCNQHGTCDPFTGKCKCDALTIGARCDQCRPELYGDARNGGTCYHGCSDKTNRVELMGSSGAFGSGETQKCQSLRHGPGPFCHRVQHSCSYIINTAQPHTSTFGVSVNTTANNGSIVPAQRAHATTLIFESFETECSWDVLRVYDGPSFSSPLLGVFSGVSMPPVLYSTSPVLLVYMYSDYNWALAGFQARSVAYFLREACSKTLCDAFLSFLMRQRTGLLVLPCAYFEHMPHHHAHMRVLHAGCVQVHC